MNYLAYYDAAYPCHFLLDVQPQAITLVTSVNDEQSGQPGETVHPDFEGMSLRPFPAFTLSMDDIKSRTDAKDCCWWGIIDREDYSPNGIMNLTAMSYSPRMPLSLARFGRNANTQVQFFLPYLNGGFTEADFCVSLRPGFQLAANIPFTPVARNVIGQLRNEGMLGITLTGPDAAAADVPVTVSLQVTRRGEPIPCPVDVELESVGGYLPRPRVRTTASGEGQFRAIPLGLEPGETFKVKAGFRFFAGLGEKVIQVVEHV
jgi:hypothetical protein